METNNLRLTSVQTEFAILFSADGLLPQTNTHKTPAKCSNDLYKKHHLQKS